MARSTVFHYKGNLEDPQKIGQALQVSAVLMDESRNTVTS